MDQHFTTQITSAQDGQSPSSELLSLDDTSSIETEFIDPEEFSKAVEYHVLQYKTTYMEAIMEVATKLGMEPTFDSDQIKVLIDRTLKEKLYIECVKNHTVKGEVSNPIDC